MRDPLKKVNLISDFLLITCRDWPFWEPNLNRGVMNPLLEKSAVHSTTLALSRGIWGKIFVIFLLYSGESGPSQLSVQTPLRPSVKRRFYSNEERHESYLNTVTCWKASFDLPWTMVKFEKSKVRFKTAVHRINPLPFDRSTPRKM